MLVRAFEPGLLHGDRAVVRGRQTAEELPAAEWYAPCDETQLRRREPGLDSPTEKTGQALANEALTPRETCQRASRMTPLLPGTKS